MRISSCHGEVIEIRTLKGKYRDRNEQKDAEILFKLLVETVYGGTYSKLTALIDGWELFWREHKQWPTYESNVEGFFLWLEDKKNE